VAFGAGATQPWGSAALDDRGVIDERAPVGDRVREIAGGAVAVIFAPSTPTPVRVAGISLVRRAFVSAVRVGFDHVVVLAADVESVRAAIGGDACPAGSLVVREHVDVEPGAHLTMIAGDVLVTVAALRRLSRIASGDAVLAYAAGRPALARCRGRDLAAVGVDAERGARLAANDAAAAFETLRGRGVEPVSLGDEVCRVVGPGDVARAEAALCAGMRAESAATDGLLARRIDRAISCRLSLWLVRHTRLRPNTVTAIGTVIGLAGAVYLARGTYASGIAGTLLFLAAAIVDGCDGEVARLTFRESTFGQRLDVTTDNLVHAAIFVGLAVGFHRRAPDGHAALLATLLLGGLALDGLLSYYFLVVRTEWRAEANGTSAGRRQVLRALEAMMNRDFAYLLVLLAFADRLSWFLWGAAIGSYVFAALFVLFYRAGQARDDAVPA